MSADWFAGPRLGVPQGTATFCPYVIHHCVTLMVRNSSMGMTGFVDKFLHVGRQVAGEAHLVRCDRVNEPEHRRVKRLPLESKLLEKLTNLRVGPSIEWVPQ